MAKIKFTLPVREKIARLIGSYFTTEDIANIFNDANIEVDRSLFAKWRITLDAFSKMSDPESAIPRVLETFCHPLNLQHSQDPFYRDNFILGLNEALAYANLKIQSNEKTAEIVSLDDGTPVLSENSPEYKTSTDYIFDALYFFKNEYNKVKISGLAYEYFLGEDICFDEHSEPEYQNNLIAIKRLKEAGFITEYEIKVENNDAGSWVFAVCKIDESKITKKEEPPATEAGLREIIQKVEITAMPELVVRNTDGKTSEKEKARNEAKEQSREADDEDEKEDDCFSYDDGTTTPYENSDSELFILKTILLLHKQRDDGGFLAKELSYDNNPIEEICAVINRLIEDKILYLSANTHPESFDEEGIEGIEAKNGFINWQLVEKLKSNPSLMNGESNAVSFDTYILDEIKLKGRIDIAIEEFMNDRIFTSLGYQADKNQLKIEMEGMRKSKDIDQKIVDIVEPKRLTLPYIQQREIILNELLKNQEDTFIFQIKSISNPNLDVFKVLLSLEKEGYIRIKGIGNGLFEDNDKQWEFITKWTNKDDPFVKIEIIKRRELERENQISKASSANTKVENGIGYFKFYKQGENIKIGGVGTRHFRLLQFLCSPANSAKTVDTVFDAIKKPSDKNDQVLTGFNSHQIYQRKLDLIKYAIKELQKNKKVQKRLKFELDQNQKTYRLQII